ncbi:hypothetical protein EW026_g613 [Hermanssonia centrifuga]|uniref:Uncharacterized protein n=1 Tax=Hermanssonia centrifuga TaxID=98765 RepID=A0A4S4KU36_9APHY|nr:hypothetical protein EW026_g613 [Hermanssonia centrifuga]
MSSQQLVWLITGTSSGLGRCLTLEALKRGDKLEDLKAQGADTLELDVTAPPETLEEVAKKAIQIYGRIDVLVHNAGYGELGPLEEKAPKDVYDQFNTHIFGPLNINRAFLPYMRERRAGTVVWVGSLGGWKSIPTIGLYCATKHAIRGLSEALHTETSPFGLRSICIDAGFFRSNITEGVHHVSPEARIDDYRKMVEAATVKWEAMNHRQPGDPEKFAGVIVDVVRGEGSAFGKPFPLSLPLGSDAYGTIKEVCENMTEQLGEWKDVICSTDFPKDT